jgi:hypothetical protein
MAKKACVEGAVKCAPTKDTHENEAKSDISHKADDAQQVDNGEGKYLTPNELRLRRLLKLRSLLAHHADGTGIGKEPRRRSRRQRPMHVPPLLRALRLSPVSPSLDQ